jgi:hypothetical protein
LILDRAGEHSNLNVLPRLLEWNVVFYFALFEPSPIGLDEFQRIGDQLE